jgi:TolB-like protein/Tfp pilus assembly protein PilF
MKGRFASRSVAVLPFLDLSPTREFSYFCDGLTEQLIDVLSRVDGLKVPGRTSSYQFRDGSGDLRTIGAALHVNHILEGSVRKAGNRLRITAQLIDVDTGFHLWSQTFERQLEDIFALQDEISRAVSNALQVRMKGSGSRIPTRNDKALRTYLEGRYRWYQNDFVTSAGLFQTAIQKDPGYAMAYAGLARAYARMDSPEALPKAEEAARRALEIDETLTEAVLVLAIARLRDWDWAGAEREFQRALKLDPQSAEAHGEYAIAYLAPKGDIEHALRESARSLYLDPASPFDAIRHGVLLTDARRYQDAETQLLNASRRQPEYARRHLGKLYLAEGKFPEALEQFSNEPIWRAVTLARARRFEEARRVPLPGGDPYAALYWAAVGDSDRAFALLEEGRNSHSLVLTTLVSPVWDPLRKDSRFAKLLTEIGL